MNYTFWEVGGICKSFNIEPMAANLIDLCVITIYYSLNHHFVIKATSHKNAISVSLYLSMWEWNATIWAMPSEWGLYPLAPGSDYHVTFPCNFHKLSNKQVMIKLKRIRQKFLFWFNTKFSQLIYKEMCFH